MLSNASGKSGRDLERTRVPGDRLIVAAERLQRVAEIEERLREIRFGLDRLRVVADRVLRSIERLEHVPEVVLRVGVPRNAREQCPVELLGFVESTELV